MFYMSYKDALTASLNSKEENQSNNSETDNSTSSYASFVTASQNSEEQDTQNFETSSRTSIDPTVQDAEEQDMQNFETSSRTSVDPTMQNAEEKDAQSLDEASPLFVQSMPCYRKFEEETQALENLRFRAPILSRLSKGLNEEDLEIKETLCVVQQRSCFETPKYIRFRTLPNLDSPSEVLSRQSTDDENNWSFSQSKPCFELEPKVPTTFLQPKIRPSDWDQVHDGYRWDQLLEAPVLKLPPVGRVCRVTGNFSDAANLQVLVLTDLPERQCTKSSWEINLNTKMKTAVDSISIDATEMSGLPMWPVALHEPDNDYCRGSVLREPYQEIMFQDNAKEAFEEPSILQWKYNVIEFQKTVSSMDHGCWHDGQTQVYDNMSGRSLEHGFHEQFTSTAMHKRPHVTQPTGMPQLLECVSGKNQDTMLQVSSDFALGYLSTSQATSALPSIHQIGLDSMLSSKSETVGKSIKAEAYGEKDSFYGILLYSLLWGPDKYIQLTDIAVYLASTGGTGGNWHPNLNSSTIKEWLETCRKDQDAAELLRNQYDGPGIAKLVNGQGDVMTQEHRVFASDSSTETPHGVQCEVPVQGDASQEELTFLRRAWKRCKEGWKKICPKAQWEKRKGVDKNA